MQAPTTISWVTVSLLSLVVFATVCGAFTQVVPYFPKKNRPGDKSPEAAAMVGLQLGYEVENFVGVAAWTADSQPAVIESYPLKKKSGVAPVPFPTLFWLSDRRLSAAVSGIEKDGGVSAARDFLRADDSRLVALADCHDRYRRRRHRLLTPEDQHLTQNMTFLQQGIAGIRNPQDVKCLHAHYAQYLADLDEPRNPIGQWLHHRLPRHIQHLALQHQEGEK